MFEKYIHKPVEYGLYDCNLMILEHLGFDLNKVDSYSTIKEGAIALKTATNCSNSKEFLLKNNYKQINPMLVSEGCILIKGIHCHIYHKNYFFGVHPDTKTFEFFKLDFSKLKDFEVFKHG